jgi:hypothetical protein
LTTVIPTRFREAHEAGLSRVVETGETRITGQTVEVWGLHKDGSEFPGHLARWRPALLFGDHPGYHRAHRDDARSHSLRAAS